MKKISLFIITILLSFICLDNIEALTGYTTDAYVAVRSEPRVASETFIYQFPTSNAVLDIVEDTLHNVNGDSACPIGWYKINYNGREAYVCGKYVSIGNIPDNNPSYNEKQYQARITDTRASVRPGPTYNNTAYYELLPGTNVTVLEKVTGQVSSTCPNGWYKIRYYKDSIGYTCASNVSTKDELTSSNSEYENYLKGLGFPDSYIPYLVKLHELHPNWIFNPIQTNLDWNTFVNLESGNNAVIINYLNDILWNLYQFAPLGEKDWYKTTDGVNAFYLDPRNFLTEKFIFMFESLTYEYGTEGKGTYNREDEQSKKYYNTLTSLLGSSYSNTDEYKNWFIGAGYNANVSPVYLASLSFQEGPMSNQNNASILGTHSTLYYDGDNAYNVNGYYNFFNINAYWHGNNSPTTSALAYACGPACNYNASYNRPWDTKEKAIYGGAQWIGDGYISNGQNTMYFKKFNSSPNSPAGAGAHQYQTNITAPCSESVKEYNAYKNTNTLDNNFKFDIPIYNNMPSVVSLPEIASNINTLKEIKVDNKVISGFDEDVVDYTVYVSKVTNFAKIDVIKKDEASTVEGIGTINLDEDKTIHEIIVTAENGLIKTYRLEILKVEDNTSVEDIINNLSVKINGSYMNHISPDTVANTLIQSILKNSPTAKVTIYNKQGNAIEGAALLETGGSIKITAPSGETKSYTTIITGDTNGDGTVSIFDLLQVQKDIIGTTKLSAESIKAGDVNNDGKITVFDLLKIQRHIKNQERL